MLRDDIMEIYYSSRGSLEKPVKQTTLLYSSIEGKICPWDWL